MRKKVLIIIISLIAIIAILISIFIYRNNLTYGENAFEKGAMYGCLNKLNKKNKFTNSENKRICECFLNYLFNNYEIEFLEQNLEKIIEKDKARWEKCFPKIKKENTSNNSDEKDKLKKNETIIKWIKWIPPENDTIAETEIYIYPNGDTLYNQHKFYINDKLISSTSCSYNLKLIKQSNNKYIVKLEYSTPSDTINLKKKKKRKITLQYLQNDSVKEIPLKNKNPFVSFEFENNKNSNFYGIINDFVIKEIENEKYEIMTTQLIIDNSNPTKNPFRVKNIGRELK